MDFETLRSLDQQYVMQTYGRFPVAIQRGEGARLYDFDGREYIDFTSGIGVNSVGSGDPIWQKAITEQIAKLGHVSNLFYSEPYILLAERLCKRSGMACAFFANGGGEANEGLIKLARKYSYDKYGMGRSTIITLNHSFHGRTITTLKATGQEVFHQYFFPFTEGFRYAETADMAGVEAQSGEDVCAVLVELIQGEGGVAPLDQDFVSQLAAYCKEKDWLLLVDEVQSGVGRTGTLFAFQQYGIRPDAVSFAKGIAGGLPMSGILAAERCRNVLTPGTHATTFGGNPVAAAAGLAVQEILTDSVLEAVTKKGAYIRDAVESWNAPCVSGIRGMGLMIGICLKDGYENRSLVEQMISRGLLALTAGQNTIRLLPPLTISWEELDKGLEILKSVLVEAAQ